MKVIVPITVNDSVLTYSNVGETDFPAWSSATTYALGAKCILTSTHKIYQSLTAGNLNKNPETNPGDWLAVAPTNRWAAFDNVVGTKTVAPSVSFTLAWTSECDGLGLMDLVATSVLVEIKVGSTVMFSSTYSMVDNTNSADWYGYFFDAQTEKRTLIVTNLPRYSGSTLTVTINRTGGDVSLGLCAVGRVEDLGVTTYGCSIGITDYSKKVVNEFGNYTIAKRAFSKRMKVTLEVENSRLDRVFNVLSEIRSTPIIYAGTDTYESTCLYGFYKDFDITIQYATMSACNMEIEGLV